MVSLRKRARIYEGFSNAMNAMCQVLTVDVFLVQTIGDALLSDLATAGVRVMVCNQWGTKSWEKDDMIYPYPY
jgi:predicted Fe-Mo cluster-binding NifX family protein